MFFNKDFYEMLSNIKAYQTETASQHSPSQNSPYTERKQFHGFSWFLVSTEG